MPAYALSLLVSVALVGIDASAASNSKVGEALHKKAIEAENRATELERSKSPKAKPEREKADALWKEYRKYEDANGEMDSKPALKAEDVVKALRPD